MKNSYFCHVIQPRIMQAKVLLLGLLLWTISFWALIHFQHFLPGWSEHIGMFFSATMLIGLSFTLVIGFSRLALHRTVFLAIAVVAIGLLLFTAKPLASRAFSLDRVGCAIGEHLLLTGALGAPCPSDQLWWIEARNCLYLQHGEDLEKHVPEPVWRIFLLGWLQLLLAAGFGLWIGGGIDEPGHLVPVALVATLADTWSVSAGATAVIIRSSTIHYFLLRFPLAGCTGGIPFLIGLTDFLFFGIFYEASVRFRLPVRRNVILMSLAFLMAVTAALFLRMGLPVLPFMAVFFLLGNFRHLALKKQDIRAILIFLAVAGVVAGAVTYLISARP